MSKKILYFRSWQEQQPPYHYRIEWGCSWIFLVIIAALYLIGWWIVH